PAVIRQWRAFYEKHADLFRSNDSFAAVGVAFWSEQKLAGNRKHAEVVAQVSQQLLAAHVPFDYVLEESFATNNFLRRYPALILPQITRAELKWLTTVADWVRTGGNVLMVGEQPPDSPLLPMVNTRSPGSGLVMRMDKLDSPEALLGWLGDYVHIDPCLIVDDGRPELRNVYVNAFTRRNRETWDVHACYHFVNYNVPLGVNAPSPKPIENLMLRLPIPHDLKLRGFTVLDPDAPDGERPESKTGETALMIKLPRLNLHKIIVADYASLKPPPSAPQKQKADRRGLDF
ncbi:MAG: hypothetical protein N2689_18155, partial [Verrucomicrobiae bacterium]|nr:hypothetical protein [Verrucomicrobiae bacterium]